MQLKLSLRGSTGYSESDQVSASDTKWKAEPLTGCFKRTRHRPSDWEQAGYDYLIVWISDGIADCGEGLWVCAGSLA